MWLHKNQPSILWKLRQEKAHLISNLSCICQSIEEKCILKVHFLFVFSSFCKISAIYVLESGDTMKNILGQTTLITELHIKQLLKITNFFGGFKKGIELH